MNLKLNNKRTILVGLAFLSICAFWQMYNSVIPKILTYTFHLDETYSGIIMAADNVLALFLLPLFGAISDKSRSRLGRRMPFILCGTGCAVLLMMLLPILDNSYAAHPSVSKLVLFIAVLGLLLVAMGTYRSPAVALMPDVTPKPLRSRANAIINLMGAVGGILYLVLTSVLYSSSRVGRRRTILFGVLLLTACFGSGYVYTLFNNTFHPALYALFALVGVAWASINVNSLPMVVEMCKGSDVGKFTGYYYTASMAAQTITPIVAGWLLKHVSYSVLFLYSAIFVALAFFTMLMVRHGDVKVEAKRGLEAFDVDD